jgi:hypothetical protein
VTAPDQTEKCGARMQSGLACALPPDHAGLHHDKFGLHDPSDDERIPHV